ncbi:hypothetical protein OsI_21133 [Oryza sativa Indica Group]|uniref:Uncharacterized protein n=1 Tax=Oryza sativa subsp. indica TaxID=39946 RepID=A2Y7W6_ORYSI|nr:hypothetical protein OsI_21133 [Oryza sativa Indica Group]
MRVFHRPRGMAWAVAKQWRVGGTTGAMELETGNVQGWRSKYILADSRAAGAPAPARPFPVTEATGSMCRRAVAPEDGRRWIRTPPSFPPAPDRSRGQRLPDPHAAVASEDGGRRICAPPSLPLHSPFPTMRGMEVEQWRHKDGQRRMGRGRTTSVATGEGQATTRQLGDSRVGTSTDRRA